MQAKLEYFGTKIDRRRCPIEGIGLFLHPWNRCREELWQLKGIIAMFIKRHQSKYHLCRIFNSPGRREASGTSCKHIPGCQPQGTGYLLHHPVVYGAFSHRGPYDLLPWSIWPLASMHSALSQEWGTKPSVPWQACGEVQETPLPVALLAEGELGQVSPGAVTHPEPVAQPELGQVCPLGGNGQEPLWGSGDSSSLCLPLAGQTGSESE